MRTDSSLLEKKKCMREWVHIREVSKLLQRNAVEFRSDQRFVKAHSTVCKCHTYALDEKHKLS